jgi:hypothetical protein
MFNWLFKKKPQGIAARSHIYMNKQACLGALARHLQPLQGVVLVYWFEETGGLLTRFLEQAGITETTLVHYRNCTQQEYRNRPFVFAGHHFSFSKEQSVFEQLQLRQPEVYASLEDGIFELFGGNSIVTMMKRMGMKEDEAISHRMVSSSIIKAQQKCDSKAMFKDTDTRSEKEWLSLNFPGK